MSDIPRNDLIKAADALEVGAKNHDLGSPIDQIQKQMIDTHKQGDLAYEVNFTQALNKELQNRGVLPNIMLEYAQETFPQFGSCRLLGDVNKIDNFLMHKFEFTQMSSQATVARLKTDTGSLSTLNDHLTPTMNPTSIDRMLWKDFTENFDHINRKYSATHRGGGWLGHHVFTGSITVGDIRKWAAAESKH